MILENMLEFVKKRRRIGLAALILTISTTTSTFAFLDGNGTVINDGKEVYSCVYKGHRLHVRCDYQSGQRRCLPYKVFDAKEKEVDFESLNPGHCRILLDQKYDTCSDIEETCSYDASYPCC